MTDRQTHLKSPNNLTTHQFPIDQIGCLHVSTVSIPAPHSQGCHDAVPFEFHLQDWFPICLIWMPELGIRVLQYGFRWEWSHACAAFDLVVFLVARARKQRLLWERLEGELVKFRSGQWSLLVVSGHCWPSVVFVGSQWSLLAFSGLCW